MTDVSYRSYGPLDAPTILFSNSLGTTSRMWEPQIAEIAEHFRVLCYDTRGHGRSPIPPGPYTIDDLVEDVVGLLDHLGIDRVHFVGLSLGGMTGMRFAARHPERTERLTVLCTSAHLPPAQNWLHRAQTVRAKGTSAIADGVLSRWFTPAYRDRAWARQMLESTPTEGYAGCCEAIAAMNLEDDLAAIQSPTLAIAGADDPATPPPHLAHLAKSVSNGRLLVVEHAAHLANVEQPETVTKAILDAAWTR
jgi:3-oxoadipate enol-lactonase